MQTQYYSANELYRKCSAASKASDVNKKGLFFSLYGIDKVKSAAFSFQSEDKDCAKSEDKRFFQDFSKPKVVCSGSVREKKADYKKHTNSHGNTQDFTEYRGLDAVYT